MGTGWERIAEWLASLIQASLAGVFGFTAPALPGNASSAIAAEDAPALRQTVEEAPPR